MACAYTNSGTALSQAVFTVRGALYVGACVGGAIAAVMIIAVVAVGIHWLVYRHTRTGEYSFLIAK